MSPTAGAPKRLYTRLCACGKYDGQVEHLAEGGMPDDIPVEATGGIVTDDAQEADPIVDDRESDAVPIDAFVLIRTG